MRVIADGIVINYLNLFVQKFNFAVRIGFCARDVARHGRDGARVPASAKRPRNSLSFVVLFAQILCRRWRHYCCAAVAFLYALYTQQSLFVHEIVVLRCLVLCPMVLGPMVLGPMVLGPMVLGLKAYAVVFACLFAQRFGIDVIVPKPAHWRLGLLEHGQAESGQVSAA